MRSARLLSFSFAHEAWRNHATQWLFTNARGASSDYRSSWLCTKNVWCCSLIQSQRGRLLWQLRIVWLRMHCWSGIYRKYPQTVSTIWNHNGSIDWFGNGSIDWSTVYNNIFIWQWLYDFDSPSFSRVHPRFSLTVATSCEVHTNCSAVLVPVPTKMVAFSVACGGTPTPLLNLSPQSLGLWLYPCWARKLAISQWIHGITCHGAAGAEPSTLLGTMADATEKQCFLDETGVQRCCCCTWWLSPVSASTSQSSLSVSVSSWFSLENLSSFTIMYHHPGRWQLAA